MQFNEIYPTHIQKKKEMEPFERSTFQAMSILVRDEEKDKVNSFSILSKHIQHREKKNYPP